MARPIRCGKVTASAFPERPAPPIVPAMSAPYVPLRIFSCYTMLEGAIDPKAVAKQARKLDFPAAAVTDRNGLYGVMPFTEACLAEGVQPIVGVLLGVARPGAAEGKAPV